MKKNLYLAFGSCLTILILDYFKVQDVCSFSCSRSFDDLFLNWLVISVIVSIILFFLNLFPRRLYDAWINFAKIGLPVLFVLVTVQVYTMNLPYGGYNVLNFNLPILYSLYGIFIVGSLIQIYRGYQSK